MPSRSLERERRRITSVGYGRNGVRHMGERVPIARECVRVALDHLRRPVASRAALAADGAVLDTRRETEIDQAAVAARGE